MELLEKITQLISSGKYDEGEKICQNLSFMKIKNDFLKLAYDTTNFSLYSFASYMFTKTEDERWLELAISLLIGPLCFVEGAYSIGLFHARQLARNKNCVKNLVQLLFFYDIPEKLINRDEALEIAHQVLRLDPSNQLALQIISSSK
ncbi:MAG: hypothetical protein K6G00_09615 [Treponema sp.]|nr:hypothetical protein [Treponema sp.]